MVWSSNLATGDGDSRKALYAPPLDKSGYTLVKCNERKEGLMRWLIPTNANESSPDPGQYCGVDGKVGCWGFYLLKLPEASV